MTLHSLVLRCDSFSCHCNSINSFIVNCYPRAILTFLLLCMQLYKSQCIFHTVSQFDHSSYMCSNVSRSTRINSSNVHMYILRLFYIASSIRISILIDPIFNTTNKTSRIGRTRTEEKHKCHNLQYYPMHSIRNNQWNQS